MRRSLPNRPYEPGVEALHVLTAGRQDEREWQNPGSSAASGTSIAAVAESTIEGAGNPPAAREASGVSRAWHQSAVSARNLKEVKVSFCLLF